MPSFNHVVLMGHATRDPTTKTLPSGTVVCDWGLAINRQWTDRDSGEQKSEVTFVDCTAFARLAEIIGQHIRKGKPMFLAGRLRYETWEKDGQKRSKLGVIVETFQFVGSKDDGQSGGGDRGDAAQGWVPGDGGGATRQQQRPAAAPPRAASPHARRPASGGGRPAPSRAPAPAAADAGPPFGDEAVFTDDQIPFAWSGRVSTQNL